MRTPASSSLLPVSSVMTMLAVSRSYVYKLAEDGLLPHYKIGKSVRFKESDITHFIDKRRIK